MIELSKREKTLVFIDAGYFSLLCKHFGKGKYLKVDIIKFANYLATKQNKWCEHIFYYTAPPFQSPKPTREEAERKARYDSWKAAMAKEKQFTLREGRCQKVEGEFTQKGVDTLLTMDVSSEPLDRNINHVIILACDTDFVPVLNNIRSKRGVQVALFYYSDRIRDSKFSMSNHLYTACDSCILLNKEDFTKNVRK